MASVRIAAFGAAMAVFGLFGAGLTGCSASKTETAAPAKPSLSASALQKDLSDRLQKAGTPAKSVTCKGEVAGEVGQTARCDVSFGDTNNIEALVTVTKVDGSTVDFDVLPAMTREQVDKAVAGLSSAPTATCASGLDGKVGETTKCEVTIDGQPAKRVVEVAKVDPAKLGIELSVFKLLPKQQVEDVLMQKLGADGKPVETIDCVDDVVAKVGATAECVAVTGNDKTGYDVTVTEAEEGNIAVDYQAKS